MKTVFIKIINIYQKILSPFKKILNHIGPLVDNACVFYPTCSEYTKQAVKKYGVIKGLWLGGRRILRCHPWQKEHMDPLE